MEGQTSRNPYSPSLMWVLPIACSIWIGLIVEGWFANPVERDRIDTILKPALEGLLTPGLSLLFAWLLLSPTRVATRLQVGGFILISSLPIMYLAHQRPGLAWTSVQEVFRYYTDRRYYIGAQGQTLVDMIFTIALAALGLLLLNRMLSQLIFHRVPIKRNVDGRSLSERMTEAFRSPCSLDNEKALKNQSADRRLLAFGIVLLVLAGAYLATGNHDRLWSALSIGLVISGILYFWLWASSECRNPMWSLLVLMFGIVAFSCVTHFMRLSDSFSNYIWTQTELTLIGLTILVPLLLAWLSCCLLATSNQMPRRTKWSRSSETATTGSSVQPTTNSRPLLAFALCLWSFACGAALWIPQNIDSIVMTNGDRISLRDGWLAAQFLEKLAGNREKIRFWYDDTTNQTNFAVRIPNHSSDWAPIILLVEQRTRAGDVGIVAFDEPITDDDFIANLRRQGIYVYGPAGDDRLPTGLPFRMYDPFGRNLY